MTFLRPETLALAALALIPILHHLVARLRRRKLPLPTFRFLAPRDTSERSRKRLIERLLLLLRTVAILAAVIAWARPVPTAEHALRTITESRLVIVLDRSLSMRAVVGGRTRFEEAQSAAQRLIEHSPRGTAYTLIAFDDSTVILHENEKNAGLVLATIRSATPGMGGTGLGEALSRARESVLDANFLPAPAGEVRREGDGGSARIALLSDLQANSLQDVTPGLFVGLDVQWILEPRLLVPAPPNSGIGRIQPEIFDGLLTLAIEPSGSNDLLQARRAVAGRRWSVRSATVEKTWPASERSLAFGAVPEPEPGMDSAARFWIELTGSDCLEEDNRAEIVVEAGRRLPCVIRSSAEARPYLSAAVRAIGGIEVDEPRGAILIGDGTEGVRALGDSGLIGAVLFQPMVRQLHLEQSRGAHHERDEDVEDEKGSWRIGSGALAVDGIGTVRVRSRTSLPRAGRLIGAGEMVLAFDDGEAAAIEGRAMSGPPAIFFAFGADLRSADAVLSTSFPVLLRRSLFRLGLAREGHLLSRHPDIAPNRRAWDRHAWDKHAWDKHAWDESDLESAGIEDFRALIGDSGGQGRVLATASPERYSADWAAVALACALFVLIGETLLARRFS